MTGGPGGRGKGTYAQGEPPVKSEDQSWVNMRVC